MFSYIIGEVAHIDIAHIVLENNGIGYRVNMAQSELLKLVKGSKEKIYTYMHVREDILELYGFTLQDNLSVFLKLISVSGVGPKVALAALSAMSGAEFALAVSRGDYKTIAKTPGIGPKMSQRIVLELRDKIAKMDLDDTGVDMAQSFAPPSDNFEQALSALMVLGYSRQEARAAIGKSNADTVEGMIKDALKGMAL